MGIGFILIQLVMPQKINQTARVVTIKASLSIRGHKFDFAY